MIDQIKEQIKDAAMHYWTDHKAAVIIVAVVLIIAIIKQILINMECASVNYYFTGALIIGFIILTILVAPL